MPTVSIVMPVYNGANYLRSCVDSLLAQTYRDFELIAVDDGSTDDSPAILADYAQVDPRVRVVRQENGGAGAARNTGMDLATGTYTACLDSDDLFEPAFLSKMVARALDADADVVVCQSSCFENDTRETVHAISFESSQLPRKVVFSYRDMPDFIVVAFNGWPWDKLVRTSLIRDHDLRYPTTLHNSEDLVPVFLSLIYADRIAVVDDELVHHRMNRPSSVASTRATYPFDFYTATCLLKQRLQKTPQIWADVAWGFNNWALHYLIWNIETMDEPHARSAMLERLSTGGFDELGLFVHSSSYFDLDPQSYSHYLALLYEARHGGNAKGSRGTDAGVTSGRNPGGTLTSYLGRFFVDATIRGYGPAFQEIGDWASRRLTGKRSGLLSQRGTAFFGADALDDDAPSKEADHD